MQTELVRGRIVGTPDSPIPNQLVDTGSEAQAFAATIRKHTLGITGGQTYAEMPRLLDENGEPPTTKAPRPRIPRAASPPPLTSRAEPGRATARVGLGEVVRGGSALGRAATRCRSRCRSRPGSRRSRLDVRFPRRVAPSLT